MTTFTYDYLTKACDNIDAAMFSGDDFAEPDNRKRLRFYMARWERRLAQYDADADDVSSLLGD